MYINIYLFKTLVNLSDHDVNCINYMYVEVCVGTYVDQTVILLSDTLPTANEIRISVCNTV
jgi:hypothetical protein